MPSNELSDATPGDRTTRRRVLAAGAAAATAGLAGCTFGTGSLKPERSTTTCSIAAETAVDVSNTNGDVRLCGLEA